MLSDDEVNCSHIKVLKHSTPDLEIPKMNCDDMLHEKLNKYELMKFFNTHSVSLFVGRMKSGKTSLLWSFFKSKALFKKVFHSIYLFQPKASGSSFNDNIFDKLPEEQKYDEMTFDNLAEVIGKIKSAPKKENKMLILDDMGAYLKNKQTMQLFKDLVFNKRHYSLSIIFLTQTWFSVPKEIRRLFDNIVCFRCSKNELQNLFDEVVEKEKDNVLPISKMVFNEPYQWLFINTSTQRIFKKFDELIFPE